MRYSSFSLLFPCAVLAATWATPAGAQTTLKDAYHGIFHIGAALNAGVFNETDTVSAAIVKAHFDAATPENVLKWEVVHPSEGTYDFAPGDAYVAYAERNHLYTVGHCLVWHSQTPQWVFEDGHGHPATREQLLARMRDHIHTVVGRYKGRIQAWDVVNEALDEDGSLRRSPWLRIIGPDYIARAFQYAHEADPAATLNYNDYSLENPAKRAGLVKLMKSLLAGHVPVNVVGSQDHLRLDWPSVEDIYALLTAIGELGLKAAITELDIDVLPPAWNRHTADVNQTAEAQAAELARLNPYVQGLPPEVERRLTARWGELFRTYRRHVPVVERVTLWGVTDRTSWLNNWPVRGRTSYPLLFDREGRPKPALAAVLAAAKP